MMTPDKSRKKSSQRLTKAERAIRVNEAADRLMKAAEERNERFRAIARRVIGNGLFSVSDNRDKQADGKTKSRKKSA